MGGMMPRTPTTSLPVTGMRLHSSPISSEGGSRAHHIGPGSGPTSGSTDPSGGGPRRRLQRRQHARRDARPPARVVHQHRRPRHGLRRRQHRRHLRGRAGRPGVLDPADHGRAARAQPRLRREPEGRLRVGDRARARHRGAAARRRPVRAGGDRATRRAPRLRNGRRGLRVADDGQGPGPRRRHADVQVRRQPDPDQLPEPAHRRPPHRVAQRLPRLPGRRARRPAAGGLLQRLRLRHRDHPGPALRREADRRGADPDLLRRRDLLRQRPVLRPRRDHRRGAALGQASTASAAASPPPRPTTYALKESYGSHAVLLRWLAQRPAAKVLDAGCFDGRFADMARRQGPPRHRPRPPEARRRRPAGRLLHRGRPQRAAAGVPARRVRRRGRRRHPRARRRAALPAQRAGAGPQAGRRDPGVGPELRALVPPRPHRPRQVRLRPAWPARPRPCPLLHARLDRGADRQLRPA